MKYDNENKKHIKERFKKIPKLGKCNRRRNTRNLYGSSNVFSGVIRRIKRRLQMTEKEAKKELYSYLHSKKLEERKLEQIEEIKTKLTKTTTILSDLPKRKP